MRFVTVLFAVSFIVQPVAADETADAPSQETEPAAPAEEIDPITALLRAIRLPEAAVAAREAGLPEEQISEVLARAQREEIPASETEVILEEGAKMAREGRADNFGSFVQAKLAEGLRGRDLAEAIHAQKNKGKGPKGVREAVHEQGRQAADKTRETIEAGEKDVRAKAKGTEHEVKKGHGKEKKKAEDAADKAKADKPGR